MVRPHPEKFLVPSLHFAYGVLYFQELTGNISALAYRGLVGLRLYYDNQHTLKKEAIEKSTFTGRAKKISMVKSIFDSAII